MDFMTSVKTCFKKYFDINGRASRSEYWWFFLFVFIISAITLNISFLLNGIISLLLICPSFAVQIRRLHDDDMSGWFVLLHLIPFIGTLIILYFMVTEGTKGPNRFGNPVV